MPERLTPDFEARMRHAPLLPHQSRILLSEIDALRAERMDAEARAERIKAQGLEWLEALGIWRLKSEALEDRLARAITALHTIEGFGTIEGDIAEKALHELEREL